MGAAPRHRTDKQKNDVLMSEAIGVDPESKKRESKTIEAQRERERERERGARRERERESIHRIQSKQIEARRER